MTQMPPVAPGPGTYGAPPSSQSTGLAVGSMICGVLSIVLSFFVCLWFLAVPLGLVAIILGVLARGKIARGEAGGAGLAKAGLICGIIGVILSVIITVAITAGLRKAGSALQQEAEKQQRRMEQQQRNSTTQPSTPE